MVVKESLGRKEVERTLTGREESEGWGARQIRTHREYLTEAEHEHHQKYKIEPSHLILALQKYHSHSCECVILRYDVIGSGYNVAVRKKYLNDRNDSC